MPSILRALILPALLASAAQPAHACSLQMVGIARDTAPYFVFVGTQDTAPVPGWAPEVRRPPLTLSTFGQVVRIGRLAADAGPEVRSALDRSDGRAVLVPWTVSADCRTEAWGHTSYRWITSPVPAFVSARLRPRSAWASGLPTFDVYTAYHKPFPHEPWLRARHFRSPPADRSRLLTAEEYFEMYSALPTFEEWENAPEESRRRIEQWVRAHPRLAGRYPANTLLDEAEAELRIAKWQAELKRLRSIHPPLAGTYRLEVAVDDSASRTIYVRTRSRATSEWMVRPTTAPLASAERIRERDGYYVLSSGAPDPAGLPESCEQDRRMDREGYLSVLEAPEVQEDGTRVWHGKIDLRLVARQFPADTTLTALGRADLERFSERHRAGLRAETPAVFLERPDGSVQVRQRLTFENGRTLSIRGERISRTSIACSW